METIRIIIPPKPGQEHLNRSEKLSTLDISSQSMNSLGKTNLPASKLPFTWKLYEMLEHVAENGQDHIVSWVNDGKAFRVHDLNAFVKDVVPMWFHQTKYKSFQRQLYFYNFKRVSKGPGLGSYYHPMFERGKKTQCLSITTSKLHKRPTSPSSASTTTNAEEEQSWGRVVSDHVLEEQQQQQQQRIPRSFVEPGLHDEAPAGISTEYWQDGSRRARYYTNAHYHPRVHTPTNSIREIGRVSPTWEDRKRVVYRPNIEQDYEPFDGDACRVFGDMTFRFVQGVPSFDC